MNIKIAEGIASSDPLRHRKRLKRCGCEYWLATVGTTAAGPTVYSIRRAADPLLPVTADTFQVIITLSEMAKEF